MAAQWRHVLPASSITLISVCDVIAARSLRATSACPLAQATWSGSIACGPHLCAQISWRSSRHAWRVAGTSIVNVATSVSSVHWQTRRKRTWVCRRRRRAACRRWARVRSARPGAAPCCRGCPPRPRPHLRARFTATNALLPRRAVVTASHNHSRSNQPSVKCVYKPSAFLTLSSPLLQREDVRDKLNTLIQSNCVLSPIENTLQSISYICYTLIIT